MSTEPTVVPDYSIDIIRHGLSCANLGRYMGAQLNGTVNIIDPVLADFGIVQAIELRKRLMSGRPYEYVLTSYLRRAIETALLLFAPRDLLLEYFPPELIPADLPDWPTVPRIILIPYASEIGLVPRFDLENLSIGPVKVRRQFRTFKSILDFRLISAIDATFTTQYEVDKFMDILYTFPRYSHVAIISHGNLMRMLAHNHPVTVPNNTEVWSFNIINEELVMIKPAQKPTMVLKDPISIETHGQRCRKIDSLKTPNRTNNNGSTQNSKRTRGSTKKSNATRKNRNNSR